MERERCHHCDRPHATDEEWDTVEEDTRDDLCWSGGGICIVDGVNWRERALKAEGKCAELEKEVAYLEQNICICNSSNIHEPYDDRCPVHGSGPVAKWLSRRF